MAAAEEIKDHLNHILEQIAKQKNIENFKTNLDTAAKSGDGFLSQFYEGNIRNKDTGETLDVAIKTPPVFEINYQSLFLNEYMFYGTSYPVLNDLQKKAKVSKPFDSIAKYFCGNIETKKEFIATENLKKVGYVMFDKTHFLDEQHLKAIFKLYGKFHALSFVLRNRDFEKYESITKDYASLGKEMLKSTFKIMTAAIGAAIDAFDPDKDKVVHEELCDLGNHIQELFTQANEYKGKQKCLVHGDCWSNNMLFKYSASGELLNIKLIDFQITRKSTPIHDLSYFFYSGASKKDFDNLDHYLEMYHKSFSEFANELGGNPVELLSLDTLKKEWKQYGLFGILLGIYLWQVKLTPKEKFNTQQKQTLEERYENMEKLLKNVHQSELYRTRTSDILRHAFEYGILSKSRILGNKI